MIRDNYLDISKITKNKEVFKLFRAVENYGGVLRFVGGCVRDAICGIEGFDLDLATDLSPDEMVEACQDYNIKTVPIGIKYGTVGVVLGQEVLEVTSLRKDVKTDGRHAEVVFTDDWSVDASRRDLTINAVYADEKGNVFDYYNGLEDLEQGIVRFIGNPNSRIKEDYLRILRFFRFYSIFGKTEIDAKALKACADNREGIKSLSGERIRDELKKLLVTPKVIETVKIMYENKIFEGILPYPKNFAGLEFLVDWFDDTQLPNADLRREFILTSPNKDMAEKIANTLKMSKKRKNYFVSLANSNLTLDDLVDESKFQKIVYKYGKEFAIDKLIIMASIERRAISNIHDIINKIDNTIVPVFPIRGKDMVTIGFQSRQIKDVLEILESKWIDSNFTINRDELLSLAEIEFAKVS